MCRSRGWKSGRCFGGGKAVRAYPVLTCGPELDGLVEAMAECEDLDSQVVAVASLAAHLLLLALRADRCGAGRAAVLSGGRSRRRLNWLREVVRDRDGAIRPKSLSRWRRLTLLAQGTQPPMMLLEDAEDVCDFLEATRRTVPARAGGPTR